MIREAEVVEPVAVGKPRASGDDPEAGEAGGGGPV